MNSRESISINDVYEIHRKVGCASVTEHPIPNNVLFINAEIHLRFRSGSPFFGVRFHFFEADFYDPRSENLFIR